MPLLFSPVWEDVFPAVCPDHAVVRGHVVHQAGKVELPLLLDVEMVGVAQESHTELQHCQSAPDSPYSSNQTGPLSLVQIHRDTVLSLVGMSDNHKDTTQGT